jgi:hypothetical protein
VIVSVVAIVLLLTGVEISAARPATATARQADNSQLIARELLRRALTQATTLGSVHAVFHVHGAITETFIGDIGTSAARRTITQRAGHAEIRFVDGVVYIRGDAGGLVGYFLFPPTRVRALANKWVSIQPTDPDYANISSGVTLADSLQEMTLVGKLSKSHPQTLHGQRVIAISGGIKKPDKTGSATIYVRASGEPLPVEVTERVKVAGAGTVTFLVTFSGWGTPVVVTAPSDAIPLSSLRASPPS